MKLGIDFGTTNSAVAVSDPRHPERGARTVELFAGERVQRTVIYASPEGQVSFGNAAFRAYVDHDLEGRFLRSIKIFLPHDVPRTTLAGQRVSFEELVTRYLVFLRERVEERLDAEVTSVTVGRPVRFDDDDDRDRKAVAKLTRAVHDAGIRDARLQLEPVAAAHAFEATLTEERVVLVGDFGGGTSDFAVLKVGPRRRRAPVDDRLDDVLATSGVPMAGNVLDGCFMDTFLLDSFGRGHRITPRYATESEPWDHPILRQIQQLYYLHLLRSDDLERRLAYVERYLDDPVPVRRLRRLVFDDLGYPMAWAIEGTKRALSEAERATFRFDEFHSPTLNLACEVDRGRYAEGCEEVMRAYDAAIDEALRRAGLGDDGIDDVFLTGGTAQLPFLRQRFVDRFSADRLRSADAFTSVCEGLALC